MPPARSNLQRATKAGKSVALCVAGVMVGVGLYVANLAYLHTRVDATLIASIPVSQGLTSVAVDPNGNTLAAGSNDLGSGRGRATLWNIADPARPVKVGQTPARADAVNRVAYTSGGTLVTSDGNAITLWDAPKEVDLNSDDGVTLVNPHHPSAHKGHMRLVSNGQTPAVGHSNGTITLWTAAHPAHPVTLGQPPSIPRKHVPSAAFTSDGKTLAFINGGGKVTLRNTNNPGHPLSQLHAISTKGDWVQSVAFFPSGETLVTGSFSGTVTLWNVTNPVRPVKLSQPLTGTGPVTIETQHNGVRVSTSDNSVSLVAVSPDGKTLVICNGDGTVTLWNVTNPAQPVKIGQPIKASQDLNSVAFTPDSKILVTGSFNGTPDAHSQIKIWRL